MMGQDRLDEGQWILLSKIDVCVEVIVYVVFLTLVDQVWVSNAPSLGKKILQLLIIGHPDRVPNFVLQPLLFLVHQLSRWRWQSVVAVTIVGLEDLLVELKVFVLSSGVQFGQHPLELILHVF